MGFVIAALLMILCIFAFLFWLSLKQMSAVMHFFLVTLLSEENYRKHQNSLKTLASDISASNAIELLLKIETVVRNLIWKGDKRTVTAAAATLLWETKQPK